MPKKLTQKEYVKKASEVHNNFYDYSKVVYTKAHNKIEIICPIHGSFEQKACGHTNAKQGCPSCAGNKPYTTEEFIHKAVEVHELFYDYSTVTYEKAHKEVTIVCPTHGPFLQLPYVHLQGHRCPSCSTDAASLKMQNKDNLWSYSGWKNAGMSSAEFVGFSLYIIRCWEDNEAFIKVGKTFTSVARRFRGVMPYKWELLDHKVGSADYISELEHELHTCLKPYTFTPSKSFNGCFECYTTETQEYINDFFNKRATSRMRLP